MHDAVCNVMSVCLALQKSISVEKYKEYNLYTGNNIQ